MFDFAIGVVTTQSTKLFPLYKLLSMNNKCNFWTNVPAGPDLLDQKTNQRKDTQSHDISVNFYGLPHLKKMYDH